MSARPARAAVYGGGGFFGIAYGLGVVHGLRDAGLDLTDVPALGTSAGSWVASAMVRGLEFADFDAMAAPRVPDRRRGLLRGLASQLFGHDGDGRVKAVVVPARGGRRVVLDGGRAPLADLCAASAAVPGLFAPHRIGRYRYVDGGVRSGTSVDLAPRAAHLTVVVPLGGAALGGAGRVLDALLAREVRRWQARNPAGCLAVIRPNRAIAGQIGLDPRRLFDADRAKSVYPLAREQGRRWGDRLLADPDPLVA